ncbi:MAG TPA: hypothetical protein VGV39_22950 [Mesorhizobium sp.]|jgi:hypothetical protein|nr:hypothetical protein [Mesorhizobium sp.]HEV2505954.1 hypothetical protein [Mesorhizobium sp.]
MLRILILALFGYCAYRVGRELVDSVPDDFDIVGPPQPAPARTRATRRR